MKNIVIFFGLLSLSLTGLAVNIGSEQLLGVTREDNGFTFQVTSNGCTEKADFKFTVEHRAERMGPLMPAYESHYYISVSRLRVDRCEVAMNTGTKIFVSFDELQIPYGKYHVTNPIGGEKGIP
jgi:hypothetical protein